MDLGLIRLNKLTGDVTFEIGDNPPLLTGMNKLVQIVLITMITTSGSDKFDNYGGGLLSLLGKPLNPNNVSAARSDVSVIVNATQAQILAEQTDPDLPTDERLKQIDLVDVTINTDLLEIEMAIRIINEDDEIAYIRL
jgi:hypothetical protein